MSLSSYFWDCGFVDSAALAVADVLCAQRWGGALADISCQDVAEQMRASQARGNDMDKVRGEREEEEGEQVYSPSCSHA